MNEVLEVLYGGAAGGGKSEGLLRGAAEYVDVPGYSALLLRRTFKELSKSGALMDRAHEWFDSTDAHWSSETHTWTFGGRKNGATLEFGYLERDSDLGQYQSAEYQYIGFDELTQFPEHVYSYMFSRLRRLEGSNIPIRMRAGTNPGGVGMSWVKERWKLYGEGKSRLDDPERKFIFSRLEDNPHLDVETYEKSFDQLSEITYAQLRRGDWSAQVKGSQFDSAWFTPISQDMIPERNMRIRYWDLAASIPTELDPDPDWTAGVLISRSDFPPAQYADQMRKEGTSPAGPFYYIENIVRDRQKSGDVEDIIRTTAYRDGYAVPVWIEQERGATGKGTIQRYREEVLPGFKCRGMWLTGPKPERIKALSSRAQEGRFFMVVGNWNEAFLDEAILYTGLPGSKSHDDQLDASAGTLYAMDKETRMQGVTRAGAH